MTKYFNKTSLLLFIIGIISIFSGNNVFMLFIIVIINFYLLYKIKGRDGLSIGIYGIIISMLFGGFGIFLYGLISYFVLFANIKLNEE